MSVLFSLLIYCMHVIDSENEFETPKLFQPKKTNHLWTCRTLIKLVSGTFS